MRRTVLHVGTMLALALAATLACTPGALAAKKKPVPLGVTITSKHKAVTTDTFITIVWKVTGKPKKVTCTLDAKPAPCVSNKRRTVKVGKHVFVVTVTPAKGKAKSASVRWTVVAQPVPGSPNPNPGPTPTPPDTTAPGAVTVSGGSSSWSASAVTITGSGATDNVGVARYDHRSSTDGGISWTDWAAGDSLTVSTEGTTSVQFRAVDAAGNPGAEAPAAGTAEATARIDLTIPTPPGSVKDGAIAGSDLTATGASTQASLNWTDGADALSGLDRHETCITTSSTGADCTSGAVATWTAAAAGASPRTVTGLSLAEGTLYGCVRAVDVAGNRSSVTCSNGVAVDLTAPLAPTSITDGTASTSNTTVSIGWVDGVDAHLVGSQYCLSTSPTGADCTSTAIHLFGNGGTGPNGGLTPVVINGLSLAQGTVYGCVRALDVGGRMSPAACGDGFIVDSVAPTVPTGVVDGTYSNLTNSFSFDWTPGFDLHMTGAQVCVTATAGGADCAATPVHAWSTVGLVSTTNVTGLTLSSGTTYYGCVRSLDVTGAISNAVCADGKVIDTVLPTAPGTPNYFSVLDPAEAPFLFFTEGTDAIHFATSQECVTASSTGTDCGSGAVRTWISTSSPGVIAAPAATDGATLYVCVRSLDGAGNASAAVCGSSFLTDKVAPLEPTAVDDGVAGNSYVRIKYVDGIDTNPKFTLLCVTEDPDGLDCNSGALHEFTSTTPGAGAGAGALVSGLSLVSGTTYYGCVMSVDGADHTSATECGDGLVGDTTPPVPPIQVEDFSFGNSTTQVPATYLEGVPDAHPGTAEVCVTTSVSGGDCDDTAIAKWQPSASPATITIPAQAEGSTFRVCVRSVDLAGNASAALCGNGLVIDLIPPPPTNVVDNIDTTDNSQVELTFTEATDTNFYGTYVCFSTTTSCDNGGDSAAYAFPGAGNYVDTGVALADGHYYGCARSYDMNTQASPWVCGDGFWVDTFPPGAPYSVSTPSVWGDPAKLHIHYDDADDDHPLVSEACVSGSPTGSDCNGGSISPWAPRADGGDIPVALSNAGIYYVCVRSIDWLGQTGGQTCGDPISVDLNAPNQPTGVTDGSYSTTGSVQLNWVPGTDAHPYRSEYCLTTMSDGSNCAAGAVRTYTSTAASAQLLTGLALMEGTTYYGCVRAVDAVGNVSPPACADGVVVDLTDPMPPFGQSSPLVQTSTTMVSKFFADGSDLHFASTEVCVTDSNVGAGCDDTAYRTWYQPGPNPFMPLHISTPPLPDATHYVCLRSADLAGRHSAISCNAFAVDTISPAPPTDVDDGAPTQNTTSFDLSWTAGADANPFGSEYCVSLSPTGGDCFGGAPLEWQWTPFESTTASVALDEDTYYGCVRTKDAVAHYSAVVCGDGHIVDTTPPFITAPSCSFGCSGFPIIRQQSMGAGTIVIQGSYFDSGSGVADFSGINECRWAGADFEFRTNSGNNFACHQNNPIWNIGTYPVTIRIHDRAGNESLEASQSLVIVP